MLAVADIISITLFFLVIVVTMVMFVAWIIFTVLRGIMNGVAALFHGRRPTVVANSTVCCLTRGCGAANPPHARFCRRCGRGLPTAARVQVRRAAVW